MIRVSSNGGSEQSGGRVRREKRSDSGSLLEIEQKGLTTQDLAEGAQWLRGTGHMGQLQDLGLNSWKNVGPFSGEDVGDREEWGNTVRGARL